MSTAFYGLKVVVFGVVVVVFIFRSIDIFNKLAVPLIQMRH